MTALAHLRATAVAQQHSSGDVHGVSVRPSQLLALMDEAVRVRELEAALRFYAEGEWANGYPGGVYVDAERTTLDFGDTAREALGDDGPHRVEETRQLDALVGFVRRVREGDFGHVSGEGLEIANEILVEFERTVQ